MKQMTKILAAVMVVFLLSTTIVLPVRADNGRRGDGARSRISGSGSRDHSRQIGEKEGRSGDRGDREERNRTPRSVTPTPSPAPILAPTPAPIPTPTPAPIPAPIPKPPASTLVSFSNTILPIFDSVCNGCHPTAGVSLSNYTEIKSRASNLGMGRSHLNAAQRSTIADWVNQGALNN
jgi:hypothetical protein